MTLFYTLGFRWDRAAVPQDIPIHSVDRAVFLYRRMLAEYIWAGGVLEGNPCTFADVQTLLDGVTVGGHKIYDQQQILDLVKGSKRLLTLVRERRFVLDKLTFCALQGIVACSEASEWGHFRGEGAQTKQAHSGAIQLPTETDPLQLERIFADGLLVLAEQVPLAFERALAFFLFGALHQFFFKGNTRASLLMMNGLLMAEGIDALSIPAARAKEFHSKIVDFSLTRDATAMMTFMVECHPDAAKLLQINADTANHTAHGKRKDCPSRFK